MTKHDFIDKYGKTVMKFEGRDYTYHTNPSRPVLIYYGEHREADGAIVVVRVECLSDENAPEVIDCVSLPTLTDVIAGSASMVGFCVVDSFPD